MGIYRFFLTEFIYNGHLQSLGGVGVVYFSSLLLYGEVASLPVMILVYLLLQIVYLYDRYRDLEKDRKTNEVRTKHLLVYRKYIPAILIGMLLALGVILLNSNVMTVVLSVIIGVLGIMYPIYFKGLTKRVFLFKNFYVSSVYAVFVFYPAVYSGRLDFSGYAWFIFLYVMAEMMISQVILDVKDEKSDSESGYLTLPVIMGSKRMLGMLNWVATLLFFVFGVIGVMVFNLREIYLVLLCLNFGINLATSLYVKRGAKLGFLLAAGKFFGWLIVGVVVKILL